MKQIAVAVWEFATQCHSCRNSDTLLTQLRNTLPPNTTPTTRSHTLLGYTLLHIVSGNMKHVAYVATPASPAPQSNTHYATRHTTPHAVARKKTSYCQSQHVTDSGLRVAICHTMLTCRTIQSYTCRTSTALPQLRYILPSIATPATCFKMLCTPLHVFSGNMKR
jgi:hypothetical protein